MLWMPQANCIKCNIYNTDTITRTGKTANFADC